MTMSSAAPPTTTDPRKAAGQRTVAPWWKGAAIYHVYPRSFQDSNNDGVGDLPGIVAELDHIASLNVDALWISPFYTSPMRDFGYDIADYCAVDPIFGALADYDALIAAAHARGLKVIIDQVYSHTSDHHAWFAESRESRTNPKADWYVWADPKPDGSPPTNWQSVFGGPSWSWDARRQQYYLHNFLPTQPDLNVRNREVQAALLAVARFWLDRGTDGFRLDALNFAMHDPELRDNPPSGLDMAEVTRPFDMQAHVYNQSHPDILGFLEAIRAELDRYGAIFTVAEVGGPDPLDEMKAFTDGERRLNSAYSFDFLYAPDLSADRIRRALEAWPGAHSEGWPSWAFSNHDAPRAVSRWANGADFDAEARFFLTILASLRGNIFIYQGEELGLPQADIAFEDLQDPEAISNWPRTLGRDGSRTPMPWIHNAPHAGFTTAKPWLPVGQGHAERAADRQNDDPKSVLAFTRALLAERVQNSVLREGELTFLPSAPPILAIKRTLGPRQLICLANFATHPAPIPDLAGGPWRSVLCSAGVTPQNPSIHLAPRTAYWLRPVCEDT